VKRLAHFARIQPKNRTATAPAILGAQAATLLTTKVKKLSMSIMKYPAG
jgi:hypothetical protein